MRFTTAHHIFTLFRDADRWSMTPGTIGCSESYLIFGVLSS